MENHTRTRRSFLKALGVGATAAAASLPLRAAPKRRKPNVIIVLVDDMGWTDVVCFGSKYYETPNIDRLANEGVKFTNGYAACAVCSPTRAAVMTGRYPARTGVTDWIHFANFKGDPNDATQEGRTEYVGGANNEVLCPPNPYWMEREEVTIAEVLKEHGYTTCHVGKWHLGPDAWYPEHQGFDVNAGGCDYGQPPSYFDPYHRDASRPNIPTLPSRKEGEYLTDREADEACAFIRDCGDKPFFLNMDHYCVHTPIQAKADVTAKYEAKEKTNQKNAKYAAMVESVDDAMGQILKTIEETGVADDTLVIFTSDNGGLMGPTHNAPLRMGKGHPYEGGVRVPVILRWNGVIPAGEERVEPVTSVDYFPTICELVGADLPKGRVVDGLSLTPLFKKEAKLKRDGVYWHFPHYRGSVKPYSIVRAGDWKLLKRYAGTQFELYNLKDDLSETTDLADKMPEKVAELDRQLVAHLTEAGAEIPRPNPDYKPKAPKASKSRKGR